MRKPRRKPNVVFDCHYHVVWCTKYRRKVLLDKIVDDLKQLIEQLCSEKNVTLEGLEIMEDHIHLLISVDPQYGVHTFVKLVKSRSSHDLREKYSTLRTKIPTLWTNSYFIATTGGVTIDKIKTYIENQKNI